MLSINVMNVRCLHLWGCVRLRAWPRRALLILVAVLVLVMMILGMSRATFDRHAVRIAARARQVVSLEARVVLVGVFVSFRYEMPHARIARVSMIVSPRLRRFLISIARVLMRAGEISARAIGDVMVMMMRRLRSLRRALLVRET